MLDSVLRPVKDRLLLPAARALGPAVPPWAVTLAGLAAGLAAAAALSAGAHGAGLALWLANRLLDGLDGVLARATGRESDWGGYLDLLADFAVYAAVPLGVAAGVAHTEPRAFAAAGVLLAAFYVNAASWMLLSALLEKRARADQRRGQTALAMPAGLVEGTETIVFYSLFVLFPAHAVPLFAAMAVAVAVTAAQRVAWAAGNL